MQILSQCIDSRGHKASGISNRQVFLDVTCAVSVAWLTSTPLKYTSDHIKVKQAEYRAKNLWGIQYQSNIIGLLIQTLWQQKSKLSFLLELSRYGKHSHFFV